jgi:hypothetical protein
VFVSYSRKDAKLVKPIVDMIRATQGVDDWVFYDQDSIQAGKKWRPQSDKALSDADQVFLFWCAHSASSVEVKKEWESGLQLDKDFVPVILDATPVPSRLAEFQFVDMREAARRTHGHSVGRIAGWCAAGLALILMPIMMLASDTGSIWLDQRLNPDERGLEETIAFIEIITDSEAWPWILAGAAGALGIAWLLRRRRRALAAMAHRAAEALRKAAPRPEDREPA